LSILQLSNLLRKKVKSGDLLEQGGQAAALHEVGKAHHNFRCTSYKWL